MRHLADFESKIYRCDRVRVPKSLYAMQTKISKTNNLFKKRNKSKAFHELKTTLPNECLPSIIDRIMEFFTREKNNHKEKVFWRLKSFTKMDTLNGKGK